MDSNEIDWVFQTDDEEVLETYRTRDNYLMERTPEGDDSRCAVYFSSNDLYFPNNRARFHERVTLRNTFEWFGTRVPGCGRHIFIRDFQAMVPGRHQQPPEFSGKGAEVA